MRAWALSVLVSLCVPACVADSTADQRNAGGPVADLGEALTQDDYAITPGGWMMHSSCVHEAKDGSTVTRGPNKEVKVTEPNGKVTTYPPCAHEAIRVPDAERMRADAKFQPFQPPTVNNWVDYSCAKAPSNGGRDWFNGISGQWTVPPAPASNGGLIYLFNDLVDVGSSCPGNGAATNEILQPVLQYGSTGGSLNFGGNYWQVASWWVAPEAPDHAVHSVPWLVNPGETVTGDIHAYNCSTSGVCDWIVTGNTVSVLLVETTTRAFKRADQGVLEAYRITTCSRLPGGSNGYMVFSQTNLYQPPKTGNQNTLVEMYGSIGSWSTDVTPGLTPACNYGIGNLTRGTSLLF